MPVKLRMLSKSIKAASAPCAKEAVAQLAKSPAAVPAYLSHLKEVRKALKSADGRRIQVWKLTSPNADPCHGEWAARFRQHHCLATRYRQLKRPRGGEPGIVWQDVRGDGIWPATGGAPNRREANAVFAALQDLLVTRKYEGTVGVVTPFRAQAQVLQGLVASSEDLTSVRDKAELLVDTVYRFQGAERDAMFFSRVVSDGMPVGALGFLRSTGNLFNVAITRARGLLHVMGDQSAAASSGVEYLANFAAYGAGLNGAAHPPEKSNFCLRLQVPACGQTRASVRLGARSLSGPLCGRVAPDSTAQRRAVRPGLRVNHRRAALEHRSRWREVHRSWAGEFCLRDQLRNQRLIELGWEVKRFWVYEVKDSLDECVNAIGRWAQTTRSST